MFRLGESKYDIGAPISQSHVASFSYNDNHIDEDYIPVGCDIIVSNNVTKEKAVYMRNGDIIEILYFNKLPVCMKLYDRYGEVYARSIDTHTSEILSHITSKNIACTSANKKSIRLMQLYGNEPPIGIINAITTPSHGVQIPEHVLFHSIRNETDINMYQYPLNFIKHPRRFDPYMRDSIFEMKRYANRIHYVEKCIEDTPDIEIKTGEVRVDGYNQYSRFHDKFKLLIIQLYESEYTDIHYKLTKDGTLSIYKTNPLTLRFSNIDDCNMKYKLLQIFEDLLIHGDVQEVEIIKTIKEEGAIRLKLKKHTLIYYFDIGIHLLCRCGIENI